MKEEKTRENKKRRTPWCTNSPWPNHQLRKRNFPTDSECLSSEMILENLPNLNTVFYNQWKWEGLVEKWSETKTFQKYSQNASQLHLASSFNLGHNHDFHLSHIQNVTMAYMRILYQSIELQNQVPGFRSLLKIKVFVR